MDGGEYDIMALTEEQRKTILEGESFSSTESVVLKRLFLLYLDAGEAWADALVKTKANLPGVLALGDHASREDALALVVAGVPVDTLLANLDKIPSDPYQYKVLLHRIKEGDLLGSAYTDCLIVTGSEIRKELIYQIVILGQSVASAITQADLILGG